MDQTLIPYVKASKAEADILDARYFKEPNLNMRTLIYRSMPITTINNHTLTTLTITLTLGNVEAVANLDLTRDKRHKTTKRQN